MELKPTDETDADEADQMRQRRKLSRMIPWVAFTITALIMLSVVSKVDNWRRDWTTNFAQLSEDANDPDLRPITLPVDPHTVVERVRDWANRQSLWRIESVDQKEESFVMHLARSTRVLRFTDDIHVQLTPAGTGTRVTAQSQSRIGKADLGQNPRNLKELVQALSDS